MNLLLLPKLIITMALLIALMPVIKVIIGDESNLDSQKIEDIVINNTKDTNTTFGVVVWDLNTNQKYTFNENEEFKSASLYKLAVMYTLFYKEAKGELDTNQPDIKEELNSMITISSNEAAMDLVENYTSWEEMTDLMAAKGLILTKFTPDSLSTTPWDMATLLSKINDPKDISPEARDKMMKLLGDQTINDRIPALLPPEAKVYHKTGDIDDVSHDVGIITGPNNTNYILVIMTKNSLEPEKVKPIMAKISLDIYHLFTTR